MGIDCSGLVSELMTGAGILKGDYSAQDLYVMLAQNGAQEIQNPVTGALGFYGQHLTAVTHVVFFLNHKTLIEAGGGGRTTNAIAAAEEAGAFVRIRPWGHRKDFLALLLPRYGEGA